MAVALIVAGAMLIWAQPCSGTLELANGNFVPMKCAYTAKAAVLVAIVLFGAAIENLLKKRLSPIVYVLIGFVLFILPFANALGIGVCVKEAMACSATAVWLKICGAVTALIGLVSFFRKDDMDV